MADKTYRPSEELLGKVKESYLRTKSYLAVSKELGIGATTIRWYCIAMGLSKIKNPFQ